MKYFTHTQVCKGVTRIQGAIGEFMYLLEGSRKALLIRPFRLLLTGDACHTITYMHFSTALPLHSYKKSLQKLLLREAEWDSLLLSHASGEAGKELIHEMIERIDEVIEDRIGQKSPFDDSGHHFVASKEGHIGQLLYRDDRL